MFYSHLLLSKKGALGVVWMAAHCYKRLKKHQILQTNVSDSVDKILNEEVPVVTHRILAFLLLGVVRIYSKKVQYLYDDCHDASNKLCGLWTRKSKHARIGGPQKYFHSIALPNSFELDAFDLGLSEDQDLAGGNVSRDQVLLAEVCQKDSNLHGLLYKENTANTPPRDVLSPHYMDKDFLLGPSVKMKSSFTDLEILQRSGFPLEDRLDPMVLDEAEEVQMHNKGFKDDPKAIIVGATEEMESDSVENLSNIISNTLRSLEMLCGNGFSLEEPKDPLALDGAGKEETNDKPSNDIARTDFPEPIEDVEFNHVVSPSTHGSDLVARSGILHGSGISFEHCPTLKMSSEAEKEQGCDEPSYERCEITEKHVENVQAQLSFHEDELQNFSEPVDEAHQVLINKRKFLEVITPDSLNCQSIDMCPTCIVAPDPKLSDTGSPNVANILTPATKEHKRIPKKQKILVDRNTILLNRVIKNWIEEDPIDIKRERKKVPSTLLQVWRAYKLGHDTQWLNEPLISGISADLGFLHCAKSCAAAISAVKLSSSPDNIQPPVRQGFDEQMLDAGSPVTLRSPEQTLIAPRTPASHLIPLRSYEIGTNADSDVLEPSTSLESIENSPSSDGGLELDAVFYEEKNLSDGDNLEKYTNSARTRIMVSYLHKKFLAKRRKNEKEVVSMLQLLEGKTKKESARLFYEILALKSRGWIDVKQENAYQDIMVWEASKSKLAVEF